MNKIKAHKEVLITSFLIIIIAYSIKLFSYSYSIDTEIYLVHKLEMLTSWLAINRFSLVALKYLTSWLPFYLPLINWLTVILFFLSNLFACYNLSQISDKFKEKKLAIFFISILSTSPIFLEQFNFTLQSMEVAFCLNIFQLAIFFLIKYTSKFQGKYAIFTTILLSFCIGCYQSFVTMFITMAMIIDWFLIENKISKKENQKYILSTIAILLVSLIFYVVLGKIVLSIFQVSSSGYLKSQIGWLNGNFLTSLVNVLKSGVRSYFGFLFHLPSFTILNAFFFLFALVKIGKLLKNKQYFQTLLILGILISPLIMSIALGNPEPIRACLNLPLTLSFLLILTWQDKKWYQIIIGVLLIIQIGTMLCFEYFDLKRYQNDVSFANEIADKVKDYTKDHALVFVGSKDTSHNQKMIKGEVMGYSFFDYYGLSDRATTFMESLGLDIYGDLNYVKEAEILVKDRPSYPDESSILITDTHIIIKLS
ncbi:MAG: hypothetical protein HFI09_02515 [Bacilli bacterium]|nr:hypothetical protein [Bacilli bacterium]